MNQLYSTVIYDNPLERGGANRTLTSPIHGTIQAGPQPARRDRKLGWSAPATILALRVFHLALRQRARRRLCLRHRPFCSRHLRRRHHDGGLHAYATPDYFAWSVAQVRTDEVCTAWYMKCFVISYHMHPINSERPKTWRFQIR